MRPVFRKPRREMVPNFLIRPMIISLIKPWTKGCQGDLRFLGFYPNLLKIGLEIYKVNTIFYIEKSCIFEQALPYFQNESR
jgi:hypothetical protein